jgi:hypothetical protein
MEHSRNYTYKFLRMGESGPSKDGVRIISVIKREEDPIFLGRAMHYREQGWVFEPAVDPTRIAYIEAKWFPDLMNIFADLDRRNNGDEVLSDEEKAVKK